MKHYDSFSGAARELFDGCTPSVCPVSGGDINRAYRLTAAGKSVFMKANRKENAPFFDAEVSGLEAIERTGTIRVPEVLGLGTDERYARSCFWSGPREDREKRSTSISVTALPRCI